MYKVLLIDDDDFSLEIMKDVLSEYGMEVAAFDSALEGEQACLKQGYDLYLFDLKMPEINGVDLTRRVMNKNPDSQILIITAYPHDELAAEAIEAGARSLIQKPLEISKILHFLNQKKEQ